jgi:hypothetical protein
MHFSNPCSRAKGFVLSPLPELGTMGSKWGGARVTDSSTSCAPRGAYLLAAESAA